MHGDRRFAAITHTLVIAGVLAFFSGGFAGPAHAADKKDVRLHVMTSRTELIYVTVDPVYAKIWRNKPDKPKKVNWMTVNNSPFEELFWELRYDPSKGGSSANYFGDVDIECGETQKKVQPDKKPDIPNAEWPYSVTVYKCADGVKGSKLAEVDPRIIWKD